MTPTVTHLFCYPLKSARGFSVDAMAIDRLGPKFDRQWMVVDEQGMFVAQRSSGGLGVGIREMCLVKTEFRGDELILDAPDMPSISLPLSGSRGETAEVQIWKNQTLGIDQGNEASEWVTEYLSHFRAGKYRLVRMPDDGDRLAKRGDANLAFADGFPLLVISQASLDDLNRRIAERQTQADEKITQPLGWDRFRPNLVIDDCRAYEEDSVGTLSNDTGVVLEGQTFCIRCPIPATDQETAKLGKEPLKTLATYRRNPDREKGGVVFGRNFNHLSNGVIKVGDRLRVS